MSSGRAGTRVRGGHSLATPEVEQSYKSVRNGQVQELFLTSLDCPEVGGQRFQSDGSLDVSNPG